MYVVELGSAKVTCPECHDRGLLVDERPDLAELEDGRAVMVWKRLVLHAPGHVPPHCVSEWCSATALGGTWGNA